MSIVESIVKLLLQKLADPILQEAIFLYGVGDEIEWLEAEFRRMQCFLEDADAKQEGDKRVKGWVGDVRDVAYDAEDVIDTFVFKVANLRRTGFVGRIKRYAFIFNELIARHVVGSKIERLKIKIDAISQSRSKYGIENIGQGAGTSSTGRSRQDSELTSPLSQEPDFVGFEKELETLVARLTKGEMRRYVVSVVGMGGLGKTTLTKKLYNADTVKKHFRIHAWISVSQEHSARDLLQTITKRCMVMSKEKLESVEKMDVVELRNEISKCLKDKRYLVVLDNIWKVEAWEALKDAFPDVNNGSRVMLTTRNKEVALYADPDPQNPPHELRFLTNEESWDLFRKKTLILVRDGGCPQDLEKLGREIVENCRGLPLAIAVIGALLSRKEPWEWENVRKSISGQIQGGISSKLSLSYKDLPYDLKPCFLYLANFPDYEFRAKELIRLWAAEGFLKEREGLTLEEVGEDYLMQLVHRSMVQVAERGSSKGIKSCRIHDLLCDVSILEAKKTKFLEVHCGNGNAPPASRARRLAIHLNDSRKLNIKQPSTPHLRSMLIYSHGDTRLEKEQSKFLFQGFKLLRVLYLHRLQISELPEQIGELIHLRYLKCTKSWLKTFPSSIGNLINLQTLFVESYYDIEVPETIGKMHQLSHLQLGKYKQESTLGPMLPYWGVIRGHPRLDLINNLQTLSGVYAGNWMEGCLGKLTNLRKLKIFFETRADAKLFYKAIVNLKYLRHLWVWMAVATRGNEGRALLLSLPNLSCHLKLRKLYLRGKLETLPEFPTNLTKLTLECSYLKKDPMATLEKLKNLRFLILLDWSYVGKEMACSALGFPRLEFLHLEKLDELEEWRVDKRAMQSLLHLLIYGCKKLKKLPEGLQHVTTLKKLELRWMPGEFRARVKEDRGEDWNKIKHIPSIDIQ